MTSCIQARGRVVRRRETVSDVAPRRWTDGPARRFLRQLLGALLVLPALLAGGQVAAADVPVMILRLDGAIGPATADYVVRGIARANARGAPLVVLEMDTPGGLDRSMRQIVKAILGSDVPVATYVSPSGARAASAGTYILYASHVAAMAPGTNLGAATPVPVFGGGDGPDDGPADRGDTKDGRPDGQAGRESRRSTMTAKAVSDATAYIRSLAALRHRNADWAEKAVREAASLPAEDALRLDVVDVIAVDVGDLLERIDGRTVDVHGREVVLRTKGLTTRFHEADWRTRVLATITDPSFALVLLLLGAYGLFFEFSAPGFGIPGVVGTIALLLGLYSLHMLPVNYAGLALVIVGILLMIGEVLVAGFGVLGIGGAIALGFGALFLFDTDVPGMTISPVLIVSLVLASGLLFSVVGGMIFKARRRPVVTGREVLVGSHGTVLDASGRRGSARVRGEIWGIESTTPLAAGDEVRVEAVEGLRLHVTPTHASKEDESQ